MTNAYTSRNGITQAQEKCPGCYSRDYSVVGPPGVGFVSEVNGRSFLQPDFESRRCRHCELVFKSHIASNAELEIYYKHVDFRKWHYDGLHPTERRVTEILRKLPAQSRILDFGCSTGRLLGGLTATYKCFGFDVNPSACREAAARGITILDAESIFGTDNRSIFDAIVLVDVFEHLTDPKSLLESLLGRLKAGGLLLICTGDSDAPAVGDEPSTFWYFRNVEHVCMLNRSHVNYLAESHRLTILSVQSTSHYDTPLLNKFRQSVIRVAFDVFHRQRFPWLKPAMKRLPKFHRAEFWQVRPSCTYTADHLVVAFQK